VNTHLLQAFAAIIIAAMAGFLAFYGAHRLALLCALTVMWTIPAIEAVPKYWWLFPLAHVAVFALAYWVTKERQRASTR
jgi:hypothetical protein